MLMLIEMLRLAESLLCSPQLNRYFQYDCLVRFFLRFIFIFFFFGAPLCKRDASHVSNCVRTLLRRVSSRALLEHSEKCVALCAHFALAAISFSRILFLDAAFACRVWVRRIFAWLIDDIKAICKANANHYCIFRAFLARILICDARFMFVIQKKCVKHFSFEITRLLNPIKII